MHQLLHILLKSQDHQILHNTTSIESAFDIGSMCTEEFNRRKEKISEQVQLITQLALTTLGNGEYVLQSSINMDFIVLTHCVKKQHTDLYITWVHECHGEHLNCKIGSTHLVFLLHIKVFAMLHHCRSKLTWHHQIPASFSGTKWNQSPNSNDRS